MRLFLKKIKYKFLKEVHELIDFEIFTGKLFENLKIRDEGGKQLLFCNNSLSTVNCSGKSGSTFFLGHSNSFLCRIYSTALCCSVVQSFEFVVQLSRPF